MSVMIPLICRMMLGAMGKMLFLYYVFCIKHAFLDSCSVTSSDKKLQYCAVLVYLCLLCLSCDMIKLNFCIL